MSKTRATSKKCGKWKCNQCQSTFTKLNGKICTWPAEEFKALTADEQQQFYLSARAIYSTANVQKLATDCLEKYKVEESHWAFGGEHLPLSVWRTRGFDAERIERTTPGCDVIETPQLGKCYRVKILSSGQRGMSGWKEASNASMADMPRGSKRPLASVAPLDEDAALESAEELQARMKAEKARRMQIQKTDQAKKNASALLAKKLSMPLDSLQTAMQNPSIRMLNASVLAKAQKTLTQATLMQNNINACVENPQAPDFDPNTEKEVLWLLVLCLIGNCLQKLMGVRAS